MEIYGRTAPVYDLIRTGQARVLKEADEAILVEDRQTGTFYLEQADLGEAIRWLNTIYKEHCLICLLNEKTAENIARIMGMKQFGWCQQWVWDKEQLPEIPSLIEDKPLLFCLADKSDLPFLQENYKLTSKPSELEVLVQNGQIWMASLDGQTAGFGGLHSDGTMGLLYVKPEYRRKGVGRAIECWLINRAAQSGFVPCCHVFENNLVSQALQHDLGMACTEGAVLWAWT